MESLNQLASVILAGVTVGIADLIIKKISTPGNYWLSFKSPWMLVIFILYLFQIAFFIYLFTNGWSLGIAGNTQLVAYSITVLISGLIFFNEQISSLRLLGVTIAVIGVIMMNV